MKAVRSVLDYLAKGGVDTVFGIPAGSVNAFFDELYSMPQMTPVIAKHEGAASYMAAAYAKYSGQLAVAIGCSGPGSTNLLTGAANAMREQLPILFLTGAVPTNTEGLNASQELDVQPLYAPVTKYSVTVRKGSDLLSEVEKAVTIALSPVPGPVHVAMPIDVQLETIEPPDLPSYPTQPRTMPSNQSVKQAARELTELKNGIVFIGQGVRRAVREAIEMAERLRWPIVTTPQAKGYIPSGHPLNKGVFGFAGHTTASDLLNGEEGDGLFIIGSSLGETATNNYNKKLTDGRYVIQLDHDKTVFNRKYKIDFPIVGDVKITLTELNLELERLGRDHQPQPIARVENKVNKEYTTQHLLLSIQQALPPTTRYHIDIGEFMSYVIHYMDVYEPDTFNINVHFGAMGTAIGSAIGAAMVDRKRPTVCITGDGCFFMHGMEVLTAKEYGLPILFVIVNNARLGMVYHGHALQYERTHPRFEQAPVNLSKLLESVGIPTARIESLADLKEERISSLLPTDGPAILELAIVDSQIPPMGDRVKFLSSFGK
ncbi:thiamine pyrophosphate-binding protein [Halalkalibacterium halodurans]|uniref:Acetolactate synthase large subunit n=1 Tax=Halalkalibacterium halodurans (strain ATCC BAA-125 / DSM 18197 / FERM 7344 / JCM 9153 / C-125) TaxID=272558 RepID=Q9K659_HALH5|nr:thiamine pyrophosphate-binding protein [Halalkalibacterium halodurans]MED4079581.1 thiamine pyrophosphate-binding protein [Halalkalibacterium halodurans]MED4084142.1 thiamine pyrophosphate-binding protein [Halalkalibacterium halodurans]MED4104620.1 thiamine pyrophosphate-binding protein [Halalkalibacterium halodurans]MED4108348.1 thiamine pyrophosphate-binding protein [Halalkalibacterium halodurans]MED4147369.1 thiamine pyrophosphate-binding protein [Halalkalibacterium halodurans]